MIDPDLPSEPDGGAGETASTEPAVTPQPEAVRDPFEPESRREVGGRGCAWMAGIGCAVMLLAAVALIAAMAFNGDRILAWSLGQFEQQILADLPEGVDDDEQQELGRAFEAARDTIRAGEVDPQALQSFQSLMFELAFKPPGERTPEDYVRLHSALRRLSGEEPVGEEQPVEQPSIGAVQQEAVLFWRGGTMDRSRLIAV